VEKARHDQVFLKEFGKGSATTLLGGCESSSAREERNVQKWCMSWGEEFRHVTGRFLAHEYGRALSLGTRFWGTYVSEKK